MAGRARAQMAKNNPQLEDQSWKRYKNCEYCGRSIMVNNYDDKKSRTPKFLGLVICPWCDPRHVDDRWVWAKDTKGPKPRITNPLLYRTLISTWLVRMLIRGVSPDALVAQGTKFWDHDGQPRSVDSMNREPTAKTDAQIYGDH